MSILEEFMNLLADAAEENCKLGSQISLKELSAEGGIYAEPGEGYGEARYYDKTEIRMVPVLFLCRNADQRKCMEYLENICQYFSRLKTYPQGNYLSWLDAEVAKTPNKIGRDEDGVYHYSCILNCKLYF